METMTDFDGSLDHYYSVDKVPESFMILKSFKILVCLGFGVYAEDSFAQQEPVTWSYSVANIHATEAVIYFTATLRDGWHIYSSYAVTNGPMPTRFLFNPGTYTLTGDIREESKTTAIFDPIVMKPGNWLERTAVFSQRIGIQQEMTLVSGTIYFMPCSQFECLAAQEILFCLKVCPAKGNQSKSFKASKRSPSNRPYL